jgi:hypothetical protein
LDDNEERDEDRHSLESELRKKLEESVK